MDTALPAAERVYAHVKHAILDRTLPGGQLLTEGDIAERVGVSRTPVREGLLKLQSEGLVQLIPKRGALVVPVSPQEVEDVLEARELVEVHTARRAWPARRELTHRLTPHLLAMRRAAAAGDAWAFSAADRAFHAEVVRAAGNDVLSALHDSLRDRQMRMGVAGVAGSPERTAAALAEHEELRAALGRDDEDGWVDLVRRHVRRAGERLRAVRA
ncbi:GntR family transcriptional regulator [Kineococcus aurantiacus]|uniref:DNA-binding GntR family transcriptional regulator n=1 Tax=Kineococcus aurantiacus TaxID=37633 RepID=A0A7Y9J2M5_9ACTN|nr:GntR family transcriptional regulator [Kineococcus aurantiacus]NYD24412.1 DNA-binding GntR family transcriptional regulator [Kineococcus aurantiacus]